MLEGVLHQRAADLRGILNGVDYAQWNPAVDGHLAAHYTPENLDGKRICRADLLHAFGLEKIADTTPVIGIVSRLATQKGFGIVAKIVEELADRDLAVVALGTGDPYYENLFRGWAFRHPDTVAVQIRYDDALAHKIEAGADMFLMPSLYEPCGLNQMYSLKYGTVPIVRATGGLDDTIEEWDAVKGTGTGFKFEGYDPKDLLAEIDRALEAFQRQEGLDAPDAQRHGARLLLVRPGEGIRARLRRSRATDGRRPPALSSAPRKPGNAFHRDSELRVHSKDHDGNGNDGFQEGRDVAPAPHLTVNEKRRDGADEDRERDQSDGVRVSARVVAGTNEERGRGRRDEAEDQRTAAPEPPSGRHRRQFFPAKKWAVLHSFCAGNPDPFGGRRLLSLLVYRIASGFFHGKIHLRP